MTHEIVPTRYPQLKLSERIGGRATHRAVLRTALLEDDMLAFVLAKSGQNPNRSSVLYLDPEDARAVRDFLTDWLRKRPRTPKEY